jgi:hypothetical protein
MGTAVPVGIGLVDASSKNLIIEHTHIRTATTVHPNVIGINNQALQPDKAELEKVIDGGVTSWPCDQPRSATRPSGEGW